MIKTPIDLTKAIVQLLVDMIKTTVDIIKA